MAFKIDEIFDDVVAGLGAIKTSNTWDDGSAIFYQTNIGGHLETLLIKPVPDEVDDEFILEDPLIEKKAQDEHTDHHTYFYSFSIKAYQAKGNSTIGELRKIRMDLFHCVGKLSGEFLIKYKDTIFEIPRCEIVVDEGNKTVGGIIFNLRIQFTDDPFMMIDEF